MHHCDVKPTWKAIMSTHSIHKGSGNSRQHRRKQMSSTLLQTFENGSVDDRKADVNWNHGSPKKTFNETIEKLLKRSQSIESTDADISMPKVMALGLEPNTPLRAAPSNEDEKGAVNQAASIPRVAQLHHYNAPVHLDIGGTTYTTTLATLTKYSDSHLAKLFSGQTSVVLDYLKQNYFIDRDGTMFRHVLNYLRTGQLLLPDDFQETDLLEQEAQFYDLKDMLVLIKRRRTSSNGNAG
ncbi:BTB 2 domain containing protein [Trichuris trichiura]|uniref:BTB 2 domain containing protein n=1 Tax=Trichuris trichiura TaxID=36087 RepID=A0A077YWZ1_TRITR|nr:BTB 2 domain containing protein [Trichuris trichiura]